MGTWQTVKESWKSVTPDIESFLSLVKDTINLIGFNNDTWKDGQRDLKRYLPFIQIQLVTVHLPIFLSTLDQSDLEDVKCLFAPPKQVNGLKRRRQVALVSYKTLPPLLAAKPIIQLPIESRRFLIDISHLLASYSISDAYRTIYGSDELQAEGSEEEGARRLEWEDVVGSLLSLPAKIANAAGRWDMDSSTSFIPDSLGPTVYFDRLSKDLESLLYDLGQSNVSPTPVLSVIQRMVSLGHFPQIPINDRAPSFWRSVLPRLLTHLHPDSSSPLQPYPASFLSSLIPALPSSSLTKVIESFLRHLAWHAPSLSPAKVDERVKRFADTLQMVIGPASPGEEIFGVVVDSLLNVKGRMNDHRAVFIVRGIVAWVGKSGEKATLALLDQVMAAWTETKYVRYALFAQQFALTLAAILSISLLPTYHPHLISLSHKGRFLTCMQSYIGHPDPSIRRLGMLVAEIVSERTIEDTGNHLLYSEKDEIEELKAGLEAEDVRSRPPPRGGKRLRFGPTMWDGQGEGKEEARWLRSFAGVRDNNSVLSDDPSLWLFGWKDISPEQTNPQTPTPTSQTERGRNTSRPNTERKETRSRPKIVMLDEEQQGDRLEGYDLPSPSSSRSPSPTPSYLEEVAADPSLALDAVQNKKVTRPVYISQLIALLKEREKPEHIEMALKYGESLIRAKRSFGGELEENAIALATLVIALNDPFNLDDFDEKRQGMINALVSCSPRIVAPHLAESYFTGQLSLHQRSVILTALSMGARELAGLPVPLAKQARRVDFPSKTLPKALHAKYAIHEDFINQRRISSTGEQVDSGQVEAIVDDLRGMMLQKGADRGVETMPLLARQKQLRISSTLKRAQDKTTVSFKSAEPIIPFKDVAAEYFILPLINHFWTAFNDSKVRENRSKSRGDRYKSAGTGLIFSPLALEKYLMTMTILIHASRHSPLFLTVLVPEVIELVMSISLRHSVIDNDNRDDNGQGESGIIGACLEVVLVSFDASWELDQGRTMVMMRPSLVSAVGEWASVIFKNEENGHARLGGSGGMREGRVRSGAAGVVVKVSEMMEKWGRYGVVA